MAIRFHHRPENCPLENIKVVQCVEVANFVCTHKGISSVGVKLVGVPQGALESLALRKEDIKVLAADLDHELSLYKHLFNM